MKKDRKKRKDGIYGNNDGPDAEASERLLPPRGDYQTLLSFP